MTQILSVGPFSLWHNDPCNKPGCRDDSCGWFMRAHHGKPEVLKAIRSRMESDFDRVFKTYENPEDPESHIDEREALERGIAPKRVYHVGLFCPNGDPNFSVHGIVLNLFQAGAWCYFKDKSRDTGKAWSESRRFMQNNLFDILLFAENATDSLHEGITGMFRIACGEKFNREEALDRYAALIYGWILRAERPWYNHPRWHVNHWSLSVSWWWFLPRWIDRKLRPDNYACCAK